MLNIPNIPPVHPVTNLLSRICRSYIGIGVETSPLHPNETGTGGHVTIKQNLLQTEKECYILTIEIISAHQNNEF